MQDEKKKNCYYPTPQHFYNLKQISTAPSLRNLGLVDSGYPDISGMGHANLSCLLVANPCLKVQAKQRIPKYGKQRNSKYGKKPDRPSIHKGVETPGAAPPTFRLPSDLGAPGKREIASGEAFAIKTIKKSKVSLHARATEAHSVTQACYILIYKLSKGRFTHSELDRGYLCGGVFLKPLKNK